jgi:hypothetical protein
MAPRTDITNCFWLMDTHTQESPCSQQDEVIVKPLISLPISQVRSPPDVTAEFQVIQFICKQPTEVGLASR